MRQTPDELNRQRESNLKETTDREMVRQVFFVHQLRASANGAMDSVYMLGVTDIIIGVVMCASRIDVCVRVIEKLLVNIGGKRRG